MQGSAKILARANVRTPRNGADGLAQAIARLSSTVQQSAGVSADAAGLAVGCPVSLDGAVRSGEKLSLSSTSDVLGAVRRVLRLPVIVRTELSMAALGELAMGTLCGFSDVVVLTIGSGLGAGVIADGRLYRGSSGTPGEIGHIQVVRSGNARLCACGRRGCLEAYASAKSLVVDIEGLPEASPESVLEAAGRGDIDAKRLLRKTARYIGLAISICANAYDPQVILLRGGFARAAWPLISLTALESAARSSVAGQVEVRLSALGDDGVFFGLAAELMAGASAEVK